MPHKIMVEKLRRLELAHTLRGLRTRNNPDKLSYHVVMARDCRAKIDYILKIQEAGNGNAVNNLL